MNRYSLIPALALSVVGSGVAAHAAAEAPPKVCDGKTIEQGLVKNVFGDYIEVCRLKNAPKDAPHTFPTWHQCSTEKHKPDVESEEYVLPKEGTDDRRLTIDGAHAEDLLGRKIVFCTEATAGDVTKTIIAVVRDVTPDERKTMTGTVYLGLGIDTFAASEVATYLNPQDASGVKERGIAGFDFEYRAWGKPAASRQLWVYGETVHGVRSSEVDCTANNPNAASLPVCAGFVAGAPGAGELYILRNATSLEAFAGLRFEFATLNAGSIAPAQAYVDLQFGFLTVDGNGGDIVDDHHAGIGLVAVGGPLEGSYLDLGYGRTDLFVESRTHRKKIDGMLMWRGDDATWKGVSYFAQITVDADFGKGSDSVQSFFGLQFDVHCFHFWTASPCGSPEVQAAAKAKKEKKKAEKEEKKAKAKADADEAKKKDVS